MVDKSTLNPFADSSKSLPFFLSLGHKKGMHRVVRGLDSNCGLILLTGAIGVGKTSLSRHIQNYLSDRYVFVELGNPYQTPLEQVYYCCEKLGIPTSGMSTIHDCVDEMEAHCIRLRENGKHPVIIFEESHLLTKRHLGLVHILSNLRAKGGPLVQLILVGQLELLDLLASEGMEALNQRIGIRYRLTPLSKADTESYIHFKLEPEGRIGSVHFSRKAMGHIWTKSGGVPRLINHICAHVLDALAFKGTDRISAEMVSEFCRDSLYAGLYRGVETKAKRRTDHVRFFAIGLCIVMVCTAIILSLQGGGMDSTASAGVRFKAAPFPVAQLLEPSSVVPPAPEKLEQEGVVITVEDSTGMGSSEAPSELKNGDTPLVVGRLVLGAIAWNTDPAKSIAVVNSELVHAGEVVDGVRVVDIGRDFVMLEFKGEFYKRSISN